jgi:hypothetical protein
MPEPITTLTAITVADLAFKKFVESVTGDAAKKFTESALPKMDELRQKIWKKMRGNPTAEAALTAIEQGNREELARLVEYLQVEMDNDQEFAHDLNVMVEQINAEKISDNALLIKKSHDNYGVDSQIGKVEGSTVIVGGTHNTYHGSPPHELKSSGGVPTKKSTPQFSERLAWVGVVLVPLIIVTVVIQMGSQQPSQVSPQPRTSPSDISDISTASPNASTSDVSSASLQNLEKLLSGSNPSWREANEVTFNIIREMAKTTKNGIDVNSINKVPCGRLKEINSLWLKYSNDNFGFSVQKQIYLEAGGIVGNYNNDEIWHKFGNLVGWRDNNGWIEHGGITFGISAPAGHLPARVWWGCTGEWGACWDDQHSGGSGKTKTIGGDLLFSRIQHCGL